MRIIKGKGVYTIQNTEDGKVYVGITTQGFHVRWQVHKQKLTTGKHPNIHLQRAWNKYGPECFEFSVIEFVDNTGNLAEREQYWIDHYGKLQGCYNFLPAMLPYTQPRKPLSEETKQKIGNAHRGRKHTEAFREMRSEMMKGKTSKAFREAGARSKAKKYDVTLVSSEGVIYERITNLRAFSLEHGLDPTAMYLLCTGGRIKRHRGWSLLGTKGTRTESIARTAAERMQDPKYKQRCLSGFQSTESQERARQSRLRVIYAFIDPEGRIYDNITDLRSFCTDRNLHLGAMRSVHNPNDKLKSYRGWRKYTPPQDTT